MLKNYIKIAFRNIARNKLYAVINIVGLSMGLLLYIFGGLLTDYEKSHDTMFENYGRTYTLRTENFSDTNISGIFAAVGPIISAELDEIDAVARTKTRELLVAHNENSFYQTLRFSDPDLLKIFDFEYVYGDQNSLNSASNIVITQSMAKNISKTITLLDKPLLLTMK